jgi:hypothetical protein
VFIVSITFMVFMDPSIWLLCIYSQDCRLSCHADDLRWSETVCLYVVTWNRIYNQPS